MPGRVISLDPHAEHTGGYWHARLPGIETGQLYGFAAHGPWAPEEGLRFDSSKVLLDPYGRGVVVPNGYRRVYAGTQDEAAVPMKSVVVDTSEYDWEGDRPLDRPWRDTIVYEAHLAGFTASPSSGVAPARRGTYAGFIEKIPYLVGLGITAVELLPIFQFDALAAPPGRTNYWGYQPVRSSRRTRRTRAGPGERRRGRVPRPGQGAPPSRAGGDPGRRLQPHGRGGRDRPDVQLPGAGQRRLLPAGRRGPLQVLGLQRHRQHVQRERPDRPPTHPRQPPLLGRGDARRRVPVRPGGGPVAR